jgi:hypothetical protein
MDLESLPGLLRCTIPSNGIGMLVSFASVRRYHCSWISILPRTPCLPLRWYWITQKVQGYK